MEKPYFHSLSAPREEFPEPPSSTRIILTSSCELFPDLITPVWKPSFSGFVTLKMNKEQNLLSIWKHIKLIAKINFFDPLLE